MRFSFPRSKLARPKLPRPKLAIGILVDASGSITSLLGEVRRAVLSTYQRSARLNVPLAVWGLSGKTPPPLVTVVPFGMPSAEAETAIEDLQPGAGTKLSEPMVAAADALAAIDAERQVLLVVTDSSSQEVSEAATKALAKQSGVEISGVHLGRDDENDLDPLLGGFLDD